MPPVVWNASQKRADLKIDFSDWSIELPYNGLRQTLLDDAVQG